jgi:hypothetical protein
MDQVQRIGGLGNLPSRGRFNLREEGERPPLPLYASHGRATSLKDPGGGELRLGLSIVGPDLGSSLAKLGQHRDNA